jgi:ATPase subunit of ABC transporter with duplicated ATPase domains
MLNIQNLTYLQGGTPLLQNVNLQAFANQRIGLVGKNGCGKSTLFRRVSGETGWIFHNHSCRPDRYAGWQMPANSHFVTAVRRLADR